MVARQFNARGGRKPRRLPDLPTYYYHTNFCDLLDFVETRYVHVFETSHFNFIETFKSLSHSAQCLFVRLASRKGLVFDTRKLRYSEIDELPSALRELEKAGFILSPQNDHTQACLNKMTKIDLIDFASQNITASSFKKSWSKERLVEFTKNYLSPDICNFPPYFIIQGHSEALGYLKYLYFGTIQDNLQNFTLRDLGLRKTPDFKADYSARFDTLKEAQSAYFYTNSLHDLKSCDEKKALTLISEINDWPSAECIISKDMRGKLLGKLGGFCETSKNIDRAIKLYSLSETPFCNERTIRLRYKRGDKEWCKIRLEMLIENPETDNEYHFAQDFYQRKFNKKRTSEVTDILRNSKILRIDEAFKNTPERAAAHHYTHQGFTTYRTENHLWRTLFGLLFWDELYCSESASLHNSFERLPKNLKTGVFYDQFEREIEAKFSELKSTNNYYLHILKIVSRYHGTPNGIFRWNGRIINDLKYFLDVAPKKALIQILRNMAQSYKTMCDGFPDLMLIKGESLRFIEVKANGDVIRRNQLARIKQLRKAGFHTDIARIEWIIDPEQIYVVVDVETTGGKPGLHRITEIGAIKIQNGRIIDEYQTLLNPHRSIPPFIANLTGITNEMVSTAPCFSKVAEQFSEFMGDAIFVAHNVKFDYGFMKSEYERLGQKFRYPKLCTCSSMRQHYKGLKSYSLKNLCDTFDINLTTHHRALCDAKAAAELLKLINEKRIKPNSSPD